MPNLAATETSERLNLRLCLGKVLTQKPSTTFLLALISNHKKLTQTHTILEIQERLKLLLIDANKSRFSYPAHHKTVLVPNSEFLVEPNINRSLIA